MITAEELRKLADQWPASAERSIDTANGLRQAADEIERLNAILAHQIKIKMEMHETINKYRAAPETTFLTQRAWSECIDGGPHRFPSPWFGTIPPNCELCGRRQG